MVSTPGRQAGKHCRVGSRADGDLRKAGDCLCTCPLSGKGGRSSRGCRGRGELSRQELLSRRLWKGPACRHSPGPFWKTAGCRPRTVLALLPVQPKCWPRVIPGGTNCVIPPYFPFIKSTQSSGWVALLLRISP